MKHLWLLGEKYVVFGKNDPRRPDYEALEPGLLTIKASKMSPVLVEHSEPFK